MRLNAGDVGRSDVFAIATEHIIVNAAENGRAAPHSEEEIAALAESLKLHGQQQPCVARRIEDNKVKLVAGYGRYRAVEYLNRVLKPEGGPVKLLVRLVECNDEEAFERNLVENLDRSELSPLDIAHCQRRLREVYQWPEERIAARFKQSVSYVRSLRKIPRLEKSLQEKVGNGTLPVSTALDLAELPAEERAEVVNEATNPITGQVDSGAVRRKVREHKQENGEAKSRTFKEVRQFFEDMTGPGEKESIRLLAEKMLAFLGGSITEKQMENAIVKACKE